eukprot:TRINITY_DN7914_c0_g1_i2.p1 TRINITY_DN7914_c0_g1~~TRINITY_DN7914_c0_g1_i2.p1  ORF type:complete len:433 (+),score=47.36 TRINITY_DN7914_c0_g1_i2:72-1301(+)
MAIRTGWSRYVLMLMLVPVRKASTVASHEISLLQSFASSMDGQFSAQKNGMMLGAECYTAPLTASGYLKIRKQRSNTQVECFLRRIVNSLGKSITDDRYFSDVFVPHHSDGKGVRAFASLMKTLNSAPWVGPAPSQNRTRVCVVTPTALDFDKYRILDWIAYHKLLGVDCFLLILDPGKQNMSDGLVTSVRRKLLRSSMVTVLEVPFHHSVRNHALVRFPADAKYLVAMDVDEYLVPNRDQLRPCSTSVNGSAWIPRILAEHFEGSFGIYVKRYNYGPNGWTRRPPYEKSPEIKFFNRRVVKHHHRPKYIVDVEQVFRFNLSFDRHGPMDFHSVDVPLDAMPMKTVNDNTLSINHYVSASVEECMLKSSAGSHLRADRAKDCQDEEDTVVDNVLAGWSDCTRRERNKLF